MKGCFLNGVVPSEFVFEPGRRVRVDRMGVHVDWDLSVQDAPLPHITCSELMVSAAHTTVIVETGSKVTARHFLEFLSWAITGPKGKGVRRLHWTLMEVDVRGATFARMPCSRPLADRTHQRRLVSSGGRPFSCGAEDGHVEWLIDDDRHGIID